MAEEKILDSEQLSDEELEDVAGGTRIETDADGEELVKRGLISKEDALNSKLIRETICKLGYTGYQTKPGLWQSNTYTDKKGNVVTREEFWKNFDATPLRNWGS